MTSDLGAALSRTISNSITWQLVPIANKIDTMRKEMSAIASYIDTTAVQKNDDNNNSLIQVDDLSSAISKIISKELAPIMTKIDTMQNDISAITTKMDTLLQDDITEKKSTKSVVPDNDGVSNDLPPGWQEIFDPTTGRAYYYNETDGTTSWEIAKIDTLQDDISEKKSTTSVAPDDDGVVPDDDGESNNLLPGWLELTDPMSGNLYYLNETYNHTQWERPMLPEQKDVARDHHIRDDNDGVLSEEEEMKPWSVVPDDGIGVDGEDVAASLLGGLSSLSYPNAGSRSESSLSSSSYMFTMPYGWRSTINGGTTTERTGGSTEESKLKASGGKGQSGGTNSEEKKSNDKDKDSSSCSGKKSGENKDGSTKTISLPSNPSKEEKVACLKMRVIQRLREKDDWDYATMEAIANLVGIPIDSNHKESAETVASHHDGEVIVPTTDTNPSDDDTLIERERNPPQVLSQTVMG